MAEQPITKIKSDNKAFQKLLISASQGAAMTGVATSTWWEWSRTLADFPKPIRISTRCTRWDKAEIMAWLENRRAA